ncbi:MAG TPA: NAD(+)/NADH kinase, partial [bacterium]|nr:NAD(+)/NADH kinase [bacterium]
MKIAIFPNPHREEALKLGSNIVSYIKSKDVYTKLFDSWAEDVTEDFDVGIVIGGDGTLLRASKILVPLGVPVLGIRVGGLGFLFDVEPDEYKDAIDKLLDKDYRVENRGALDITVEKSGITEGKFLALNDAVVNKGTFARMLEITLYVNKNLVARYPADGIIVSTPTGST